MNFSGFPFFLVSKFNSWQFNIIKDLVRLFYDFLKKETRLGLCLPSLKYPHNCMKYRVSDPSYWPCLDQHFGTLVLGQGGIFAHPWITAIGACFHYFLLARALSLDVKGQNLKAQLSTSENIALRAFGKTAIFCKIWKK